MKYPWTKKPDPDTMRKTLPLTLLPRHYTEPSVFTAGGLLREARRQKSLPAGMVPEVCLLDPDGDIVRYLIAQNRAARSTVRACYHTDLYTFESAGVLFGVVGCAVGAPFAVLVAEELFSSGCQFLISMTSAGQITATRRLPYFVLIDKALRDEGTSGNYLPPEDYAAVDASLLKLLTRAPALRPLDLEIGATWTTDAPFRETAAAIERCRELKILGVEMEAAALYAFSRVMGKPVICLAHMTNQMATVAGDFEKGASNGSEDALEVIESVASVWRQSRDSARPSEVQ